MYYTYLLRCADGSLYTGITTDPARRFAQHAGRRTGGAKYTAAHRPVRLEAVWRAPDRASAARLECRIKALSRAQKERLIGGALPPPTPLVRIPIEPDGRRILMQFLCHPKCSTCKKARAFLEARDIPVQERDIREQNPTEQELRAWHARSGLPLRRLFNTSGQAYRAMGLSQKLADMSEDEQFALLASDGMLVRRPILVSEQAVLFGFRQKEWEETL